MIAAIKPGDKILLNSGMTGRVAKLKNTDYLVVEIAPNVEVDVLRSYVISVLNNTEAN
jgi:preprotein translocase YajC subunit